MAAAQSNIFGRTSYFVLTGGLAIVFLFPLGWALLASVSPQASTAQRIGYGFGNYILLYRFGPG
jgi:multiple sugar transport system permease protein